MTVDDLEAVHAFMGDPEVMEFSKSGPYSIEETKEYIQNFGPKSYEKYGFGHWLIVHKEDKSWRSNFGLGRIKELHAYSIFAWWWMLGRDFT